MKIQRRFRSTSIFGALLLSVVTAMMMMSTSLAAHAGVEDFHYESWDVEYSVGLDDNGRSTAHVTETLTAAFPDFDQNKGIVRGLPKDYQGASSTPENITVTDESGQPLPFFIEQDDDFLAILTGDDNYVQGKQTYVIEYTIPDIIFVPDDENIDEFYWDMVSVDRKQPINSFTAQVVFDSHLVDSLTGNSACYQGSHGSDATCELNSTEDTFSAGPLKLGPNETVTFAVGFEPGTVEQPSQRIPNPVLDQGPFIAGLLALLSAFIGLFSVSRFKKRKASTGRAIIAQYDVPDYLPPIIAAPILLSSSKDSVVPQFLHLAVRGFTRIEEELKADGTLPSNPKPMFRKMYQGNAPEGILQNNPGTAIDGFDNLMLNALFKDPTTETFKLPKSSESFSSSMTTIKQSAKKEVERRGYYTREQNPATRMIAWITIGIGAVAAVLVLSAMVMKRASDLHSLGLVVSVAAIIGGLFLMRKNRVHTPLGAETQEYLEGVKLFISVAESERIKVLQSYSGAERYTADNVAVLQLYERLLPYAALFGMEREWSRVLQVQYASAHVDTPYWYPYMASRGMSSLSGSMSSMTRAMATSASYTSSSSGGSSGGGFSGGGGGGGFSGGR